MQAPPNNVIVKISNAIREKIFSTEITDTLGRKFSLLTRYREKEGYDEFFAQGVSVGEVVSVGHNVSGIIVGDDVMLDYIVDVDNKFTVYKGDDHKLVSVNAVTTYMTEDKIIAPNRRTKKKTIVHKKGELNEPSLVISVVRNEKVFPVAPYILLEYKDENIDEFFEGEAIWSRSQSEPISERKVIAVHEGSDIVPGDTVLIETDDIFSRSFGLDNFDVVYGFKVIAIEHSLNKK